MPAQGLATTRRRLRKMDAYIYGERRPLPEGFAAYHDRWRSAVVSIDMHQGHLLRNLVVLNGGFTDCCILNAAFDASNLGYNLVVLGDLVRGTNQEMEDAALKIVHPQIRPCQRESERHRRGAAKKRAGSGACPACPTITSSPRLHRSPTLERFVADSPLEEAARP